MTGAETNTRNPDESSERRQPDGRLTGGRRRLHGRQGAARLQHRRGSPLGWSCVGGRGGAPFHVHPEAVGRGLGGWGEVENSCTRTRPSALLVSTAPVRTSEPSHLQSTSRNARRQKSEKPGVPGSEELRSCAVPNAVFQSRSPAPRRTSPVLSASPAHARTQQTAPTARASSSPGRLPGPRLADFQSPPFAGSSFPPRGSCLWTEPPDRLSDLDFPLSPTGSGRSCFWMHLLILPWEPTSCPPVGTNPRPGRPLGPAQELPEGERGRSLPGAGTGPA